MHALRLGETQRATHESFEPRPQIEVFALDFLRVLLAHLMLLGVEMPLVGPPPVGIKLCDATWANSWWSFRKTSFCRRPNT
jgi:hypothetical protein